MLKKDQEVKWTTEAKLSFEKIKQALTKAPVLASPYFSKEFFTFSFASKNSIAHVCLQKNSKGLEHPISLSSNNLRDT